MTVLLLVCIVLDTPTKPEQFRLKVNAHDIPASSTIKYLGGTFDQRLTWSKYILHFMNYTI